MPSQEKDGFTDRGFGSGRWIGPFLAFLTLSIIVALLNRHHLEQQSNYQAEYVSMAEHFKGTLRRENLTYPLWGYPFLLWILPRYTWIVWLQVALGAAALTLAWRRLQIELPEYRRVITIACVAGIPWYAMHSVKWPQSFAASFLLLAILALDRGLRTASVAWGAVAGLLFGAVLYFRSEFLLLGAFLPLFCLVMRTPRPDLRSLTSLALLPLVAFVLLIPWAVSYHKQTGRYSLTASQKGIVAFISLGQLPGNPWGAEYTDEYAFAYLEQRGIGLPRYSDRGDRVLFQEYKRRVAEHPGAFAKKVLWNGAMITVMGFYNPEWQLDSASNRSYESLRTALRHADLAGLRQSAPARAWAALLYWLLVKVLGAFFVIVSLIGLLLWLLRKGARTPWLVLSAGVIVYLVALQMILTVEPRYLNSLYVFLIPFFAFTIGALRRKQPAQLPLAV